MNVTILFGDREKKSSVDQIAQRARRLYEGKKRGGDRAVLVVDGAEPAVGSVQWPEFERES